MVKNKVYNYVLPHRIKLVPRSWLFKPLREPKFSAILVSCGRLYEIRDKTNEYISRIPVTGLKITKCPRGTVIQKVEEE